MVGYKENFSNAIDFAIHKTIQKPWKLILLGIMGSLYVALGYIGFIYIISNSQDWSNGVLATEIKISAQTSMMASAIFPVGLLLIIFLGGSLFTSDNLTSIAALTKKSKWKPIIQKWGWTLLGNTLGAFLIAAIIRGGGIFGDKELRVISYIVYKKVDDPWWNVFFSGILCNVLVAGTVWATLATKHSIAKIFLIYFPIWLFAIIGFHHIVANVILFAFAWLHGDNEIMQNLNAIYSINESGDLTILKEGFSLGDWSFRAVFINALPALVGNWLSGSIILPFVYFWLSEYYKKVKQYKLNGCKVEANICKIHLKNEHCYFKHESGEFKKVDFTKKNIEEDTLTNDFSDVFEDDKKEKDINEIK